MFFLNWGNYYFSRMREKYYFARDVISVHIEKLESIAQSVRMLGKLFAVVLVFLGENARIDALFQSPRVYRALLKQTLGLRVGVLCINGA